MENGKAGVIIAERNRNPGYIADYIAGGFFSAGIPDNIETAENALSRAGAELTRLNVESGYNPDFETETRLYETIAAFRAVFEEFAYRAIESDNVSDSDLARIIEFSENFGFVFESPKEITLSDIIETLGGPNVKAAYRALKSI